MLATAGGAGRWRVAAVVTREEVVHSGGGGAQGGAKKIRKEFEREIRENYENLSEGLIMN